MTITEYRKAYVQCELEYLKDKTNTRAVTRQNELLRECKERQLFTLNKDFTQLEHETMYLQDEDKLSKLILIFNYYDDRQKQYAIIPKSLYNNKYIPDTTTKRVPKPLQHKNTSLRGYEMPLQDLANILNLRTSLEIDNRVM